MRSSRKRQQSMAGGDQSARDCADLDPATKRRMRNRLSQQQFRERRSLYIKELEELSKLSSQSESNRNRALAQETATLRKEMLRLRSQVLKLSVSLNGIGSEVGKILDKEGHMVSEENSVNDRPSPTNSNCEQVTASSSPAAADRQMANALEQDADLEPDNNEPFLEGPPDRANVDDSVFRAATSEWPADTSTTLPQEDNAAVDSDDMNTTQRDDSAERGVNIQDCEAMDPGQHDCMDLLPGLLNADMNHNEPSSMPLHIVPGNGNEHDDMLPPYLHLSDNTSLTDWDPAPSANLGQWMVPTSPPPQNEDAGSYHWQQERAPESTSGSRQGGVGESGLHREPSPSIPAVPCHGGYKLPPGLLPAANNKNPRAHLQIHSRLSEHMETLEQYVRYKLDTAPEKIRRQQVYHWCKAILSLMTQYAWPSTYPVWSKSQVPEIIAPIMVWRLCPTAEAHQFLTPTYKPTELQLTVPHSPIIDWVTYAPLRDRILLCYNDNVALDRVICDYLNSHVIEVDDMSRIVPNAPPEKGYFGVWNVYQGIHNSDEGPDYSNISVDSDPFEGMLGAGDFRIEQDYGSAMSGSQPQSSAAPSYSPAPSLTHERAQRQSSASDPWRSLNAIKVLTTPDLALRLSHDVRLYAARSWRVDRSFFNTWPELKFDGYEKIVGQGRSYRIYSDPPEAPMPLTETTMKLYHDALDGMTQVAD